jgi:hypothetical protein
MLLAASCFQASSAAAQETEETQPIEKTEAAEAAAEPEEAEAEESRFSGIIQADFTNAYFFRGIMQERDSFIAEPWGELYYSVFQRDEGFIRDITIGAGVWASFHTEETGATQNPKSLYETDWYPLISVEFPHGFSLTTIYYFYTSPNDAFEHVEELNFKLAWDDSECLKCWSLQPWINLAVETHKTSFGVNKGEGIQFGIEPTLFTIPIDRYPVTVTAPVEVGFAIDDYYERETTGHESPWGYALYGLKASVPLSFMPEAAGSWTFSMAGKGISLSHTLANANLGRDWSPIGTASIAVEF